ncbi:MAG: antitoxin VapB family protein [Nitrososphaerota archaeon]|nr:antitoxin VapB family protein [Nitrososphaerota archaeon]MDG7024443.1 antitoxin VapB family protein [Nitrososphaerota archaeon]
MDTKDIATSDEAYERLKSLRKPGEGFTELVERMTRSGGVVDLAGPLTKSEGPEMKKTASELRKANSRPDRETGEGPGPR